jgi:hypothetical protein
MKVSEQIIQVLNVLCEKFGLAVDWTAQNVAPYLLGLCSKICTYEIATSIFWCVIGVIMFIVSIAYFKKSWKDPINWDTYDITCAQLNGILSVAVLICLGIASLVIICTQVLDIIQAVCIPELTIIEQIKGLTSSLPNGQ